MKTKYFKEIEETTCNHCVIKITGEVKFHFEKVPKKGKDGKDIIENGKIIEYDKKVYDISLPSLCVKCSKIPKCEACEIIMCDLGGHSAGRVSEKNSKCCMTCENWRQDIKTNCVCGNKMDYDENRFLRNGNFCDGCMKRINDIRKNEKNITKK